MNKSKEEIKEFFDKIGTVGWQENKTLSGKNPWADFDPNVFFHELASPHDSDMEFWFDYWAARSALRRLALGWFDHMAEEHPDQWGGCLWGHSESSKKESRDVIYNDRTKSMRLVEEIMGEWP